MKRVVKFLKAVGVALVVGALAMIAAGISIAAISSLVWLAINQTKMLMGIGFLAIAIFGANYSYELAQRGEYSGWAIFILSGILMVTVLLVGAASLFFQLNP